MSRALSFEGPDVDEPLDFRTLNPKDPAHPVLRTFGRLLSWRCRRDVVPILRRKYSHLLLLTRDSLQGIHLLNLNRLDKMESKGSVSTCFP